MDEKAPQDSFSAERAELFEALGHPTRIRTLKLLQDSQMSFSELKKALGIESSGLMQHHLRKLQGLVRMTDESDYAITDEGKEALRVALAMEGIRPSRERKLSLTLSQITGIILLCGIVMVASISYMEYSSLSNELDTANQAIIQLTQHIAQLNLSYPLLIEDWEYYNSQVNQQSIFLTPVSKSQAIAIALSHGGWNVFMLRGQIVVGWLEQVAYNSSSGTYGYMNVTAPLANYSKVKDGYMEYWYEWTITIASNSSYPFYHTSYYVSATDGKVSIVRGIEAVVLTEEEMSNTLLSPMVNVGQSFSIYYQSRMVTLFAYTCYENGTVIVATPEGTLIHPPCCEITHIFTISCDQFCVDGYVINIDTGALDIFSIKIGNTTIYQSNTIPA
jgi:DNA-binding transcriptional ArsR family regulator